MIRIELELSDEEARSILSHYTKRAIFVKMGVETPNAGDKLAEKVMALASQTPEGRKMIEEALR